MLLLMMMMMVVVTVVVVVVMMMMMMMFWPPTKNFQTGVFKQRNPHFFGLSRGLCLTFYLCLHHDDIKEM